MENKKVRIAQFINKNMIKLLMGTKRTIVYVLLVVTLATFTGMAFGSIVS